MLPRIGVLPHIEIAGANTLAEALDVGGVPVMPIDIAFEKSYETDAHFTCYTLPDPTETKWPRLNKPILPELVREGNAPRTRVISLDYDLPDHVRWESHDAAGSFQGFVEDRSPYRPACLYTTRSGGRIIFLLDQWVGVEEAESVAGFLIAELSKAGIWIDTTCYEWNRAYRLPFVVRDGVDTFPTTHYWPSWECTVPLESLGRVKPGRGMNASERVVKVEVDDEQPTPEEAESLLYLPGAGSNLKQTQWLKLARKRLRGRECYPCLFEHEPMAGPGSRDSTMHKYVGQATGLLVNVEGTTPQHIYALFLPAVEQFEPDVDTPDWTAKLWSSCCRVYAREEGKRLAEIEQAREDRKHAQTLLSDIIDGMREWNDASPLQHGTEADQTEYVLGHMIVSVAATGNLFLMGPDGYYQSICLTPEQIPAKIRTSNLRHLIATEQPNASGGTSSISTAEIRRKHETVVSRIIGKPNLHGGYIDRVDSDTATLNMSLYRVNPDLVPEFHDEVDQWLRLMFGKFYEKVENWLAWAVDFTFPISALSIFGPPSIGKGMLIRGLAEVLEDPRLADEGDLVGGWQYKLMASPYIVINEGWPLKMQEEPSAVFRRITGGDPQDANAKFKAPMEIHNPARLILTANNEELVKQLVRQREMTQQDREAILIKLLHVECDDAAAIWIKRKGGLAYTGMPGRAWVGGAAGQKSSYIVAKHLLWLGANRRQKYFSQRLCVEGNGLEMLHSTILSNAGSTPDVMEAIFSILAVPHNKGGVVMGSDNRIYAVPNGITQWMRTNARPGQRDVNNAVVASVLRNLALQQPPAGIGYEVPGLPALGNRRWYVLDARLLLDYGLEQGFECDKLVKCIDSQARNL